MSKTDREVGKLKPINLSQEELVKVMGEMPSYYKTTEQWLQDVGGPIIILAGQMYEILELTSLDPRESYCDITYNDDKTISFDTQYWNGGTHWIEMVERALEPKTA